jgi:myo-inositol 2-dehydrogenase/D-chiro-inositol 1-dehydrogenase
MTIRLAIIGAGFMARRRAHAFLATQSVELCGVASRHKSSAEAFGSQLGIKHCFEDYRQLLTVKPDAILVEVPHAVQDEIVQWALSANLHVFIGGPLSLTTEGGRKIQQMAQERGLVVEAGFEARYKAVWEKARSIIHQGELGAIVTVRSVALWDAKPDSWYYQQSLSGGMPLTHLTYAFLNPVRWLLGEPIYVSAFANQIRRQQQDAVQEETCVANLLFNNDAIATLTAGYIKSGDDQSWMVSILGTKGVLELYPTEMDNGSLRLFQGERVTDIDFADAQDAFIIQAEAFLASLQGENCCRNTPADTLGDLYAIEAIVQSAHQRQTIQLLSV